MHLDRTVFPRGYPLGDLGAEAAGGGPGQPIQQRCGGNGAVGRSVRLRQNVQTAFGKQMYVMNCISEESDKFHKSQIFLLFRLSFGGVEVSRSSEPTARTRSE